MTTTMLAYHGDPAIKAKYVERVEAHQKADQLIQGYDYWKDGKGCAVGCTLHSGEHAGYETELGIPRAIAYLEDRFFENMPVKQARVWPGRFLAAIRPGADLSLVLSRFMHWMLVDEADGVIRFAKKKQTKAAIQAVADLYQRKLNGETITIQEWNKVRADAAYAYASADADAGAAYAYASAADAGAAYASAAAAAADAAASAADAGKGSHYCKMAEKLLELLEAE